MRGVFLAFTLSYSNIHESEKSVVGSRALYLSKVTGKNIVPCIFFAVTSDAFSAFFEYNDLKGKIRSLKGSVSDEDFWDSLKELFSDCSFPSDVKKEMRESYDALSVSGSGASNILRSFEARVNVFSGDSSSSLSDVFLNIRGFDNVLGAVKSCWFVHLKKLGVSFLDEDFVSGSGVVVEKFVGGDLTVEVEVSSDEKNLVLGVYKGLPEVSLGVVKDFYVLSFNHLEFISYELNHQNFSILHQEESGVLLKKRLGREGADDKASKNLVSECARLAKRVFDVLGFFVKVVFVVKKDIPYLFLVDDVSKPSVAVEDSVVDSDVDEFVGSEDFSGEVHERDESLGAVSSAEEDSLDESGVVDSSSSEGDSFEDSDEFIVQGDEVVKEDDDVYSSFFKLFELFEEDLTRSYKDSFGFSPGSLEEAVEELDSKHGFEEKNKILRVLEVRSLIMSGQEVDYDIVSSLSGVLEDFLKRDKE